MTPEDVLSLPSPLLHVYVICIYKFTWVYVHMLACACWKPDVGVRRFRLSLPTLLLLALEFIRLARLDG